MPYAIRFRDAHDAHRASARPAVRAAVRRRLIAARPYAAVVLARKDELGNRAAFCAGCGWGRRFLAGVPVELPASCPDCGQPVLAECPACAEGITSLMQITCSACGEAAARRGVLRPADPPQARAPRGHGRVAPECAGEAAAAFAAADAAPECAGEAAAAFAEAE